MSTKKRSSRSSSTKDKRSASPAAVADSDISASRSSRQKVQLQQTNADESPSLSPSPSPSTSPSTSPQLSPSLSPSYSSDGEFSPSSASPPTIKGRVNKYRHNPHRKRFKLLRSFTVADFVTLGNAACGTCSIFFCLNYLENNKYEPYMQAAFFLLPLALIFDIADGYVARARQNASPYGSDLDSLADVISFAVAPAVLGFTLGLRGVWDCLMLSFFVCAGVSRLARYNVTAETLADAATGKVKYYQGFPVPTSLALVVILGIAYSRGGVFDNMWFGTYRWSFPSTLPGTFHPFSLLYLFFGCAMVSEWKIPKP